MRQSDKMSFEDMPVAEQKAVNELLRVQLSLLRVSNRVFHGKKDCGFGEFDAAIAEVLSGIIESELSKHYDPPAAKTEGGI